VGIVHLGPGAFHRAHQAAYTDAALAAAGGDWRIRGVSLRGAGVADALRPQDGLYTLLLRGTSTQARVIGSLAEVVAEARAPGSGLAALTAPETRIVSLTVTEKAYGVDRARRRVDLEHPAVVRDLAAPRRPTGVLGLLVEACRLRRDAGRTPFTALCCDNLPDNGGLLHAGVIDFARRLDPALADWIAETVAFPNTMVDRITPAPTDATRSDVERLTGLADAGAVESEDFAQWVIEDSFSAGRPAWEAGGAIFVAEVAPYETMKLRMLNGTHSLLAYAGYLSGRRLVRDAMADPDLARLAARHLRAAAATLSPLSGVNLEAYASDLLERFANPELAHATAQIAKDGTEKLPQRIFSAALDAWSRGQDIRPFAFVTALWMRYCLGRTDDGETFRLDDPREQTIAARLAGIPADGPKIAQALSGMPDLVPPALAAAAAWQEAVGSALDRLLGGVRKALAEEARSGTA
jgi:fructuronate reductase